MFVVTLPARCDPASHAAKARAAGADMLELRGDLSPDPAPFSCDLPLLLSPRGGDLRRLLAAKNLRIAALDLEEGEAAPDSVPEGCLRVTSRHDHEGMPALADLRAWASRARAAGADVLKLAVTPKEPIDLRTIDDLRRELAVLGPVIVTAMGPLAKVDRLIGESLNAWTYTCLDGADASAPGQLSLELQRRLAGTSPPRLFGLLGGPGLRSYSPEIHDQLFSEQGIRAGYAAFPTADLATSFAALARLGVEGFSVTSPYKSAMVALMDELDPLAARLQSVNTARLVGGRWKGWQTDVVGIEEAHQDMRGCGRAAIVGSGGVVPAVIAALRGLDVGEIEVFARNGEAARSLAASYGVGAAPLEDLKRSRAGFLIWTLPIDLPALALPQPESKARALDLRYGGETDFMRRAVGLGYAVSDGLSMLVAQALAQFEIFSGEPRPAGAGDRLLTMLRERETRDGK